MIDLEFKEAAKEVLDILNHMETKDVDKIPKQFKEFLKKNSSEEYIPKIDYTKSIEETKLKQKTYDLLGVIYLNYWADEEEKEIFLKKINENEKKYQEQLREKYNPDNIFKSRDNKTEEVRTIGPTNEVALIEYKESLIKKIINKIRNIFGKN